MSETSETTRQAATGAGGGPLLVADDGGGIRTLTLNRPERRNALSVPLMEALLAALAEAADDESVRVVVLRGAGPAFSAGHDLAEVHACDLPAARDLFALCARLMLAVHAQPQPVIAAVHGIATAAGCQLVAACDLAVAAESARFATPGVRIGLFCSTPLVEVSRAVGTKHALQLLLGGAPVDAATALRFGLVNEVVPDGGLDEAIAALAAPIIAASRRVVAIGKRAFWSQLHRPLEEAYAEMAETMSRNAVDPAAREGIGAFLEKRTPIWPH